MGFWVFLNGPPRSGKDSLADALTYSLGFEKRRFAQPLRDAIAAFFGLSTDEIDNIVETQKGHPSPALYGAEIRHLMIELSERWAKPHICDDVFGRRFLRSYLEEYDPLSKHRARIVVADTGFPRVELPALINQRLGNDHFLVVRIRREGCVWDSRGPIPTKDEIAWDDPEVRDRWSFVEHLDFIDIDNSELSLEQYRLSGVNMVEAWMNGKA